MTISQPSSSPCICNRRGVPAPTRHGERAKAGAAAQALGGGADGSLLIGGVGVLCAMEFQIRRGDRCKHSLVSIEKNNKSFSQKRNRTLVITQPCCFDGRSSSRNATRAGVSNTEG